MNELRKYIRKIIAEKGEKLAQMGDLLHSRSSRYKGTQGKELKQFFRQTTGGTKGQPRLKDGLTYIHWAPFDQAIKLYDSTRGRQKNEINTYIHKTEETFEPFKLMDDQVIGIVIDGYITFASKVDLDSGRPGRYLDLLKSYHKMAKANNDPSLKKYITYRDKENYNKLVRMLQPAELAYMYNQYKTSGVPSRPDVASLENRAATSREYVEALEQGDDDAADHIQSRFDDNMLQDKEGEITSIYDVIIRGKEDLNPFDDILDDDGNRGVDLNWPEGIVDNWNIVAICVPSEMVQAFHESEAGISFFQSICNDDIPVIDEDGYLLTDFYDTCALEKVYQIEDEMQWHAHHMDEKTRKMYEDFQADADADTYLDIFAPEIKKNHEKNKANKIY